LGLAEGLDLEAAAVELQAGEVELAGRGLGLQRLLQLGSGLLDP